MVNKSVKILTGKYTGLVGVVEKLGGGGAVKVKIDILENDEWVVVYPWLNVAQLEVL